jgi:transposase-like protein
MNNINNLKNLSETREQRAKAILEMGNPVIIDENTYLVPSQSNPEKKYQVTHFDSYSCNCKDFELRCRGKGLYCKHIKAILLFEKIKTKYEVEPITQKIELIIDKPNKEVCPYCSSEYLIKSGIRKTQFEIKQRYECKSCNKRFVLSPIPKIKGNEKLVCLCMDCYYRGLSYRDISAQFKQFYGLSLHHETIRRWILKFSEVIEKYSKTLEPKTSGVWNADETMILTKRGRDNKNPNKEFDYVWNVIDNKSKFLLASVNSGRGRSSKDAQKVLKDAFEQNKKIPYQIITDKLGAYQDGVRKTFRNWGNERKVKHTSILGQRRIVNNNAIESHHTQQKEFHKIRRGVKETQTYADGFKVFHNFVRENVKDKTTPAEKCGIELEGNKWNTLLLNSIKNSRQTTGEEKITITP